MSTYDSIIRNINMTRSKILILFVNNDSLKCELLSKLGRIGMKADNSHIEGFFLDELEDELIELNKEIEKSLIPA